MLPTGSLKAKNLSLSCPFFTTVQAAPSRQAGQPYPLAAVPQAEAAVHGDLSTLAGVYQVAEQVSALGHFKAVIHNAGIYQVPRFKLTGDGLPSLLAVNSLAPYVLTCLLERPTRLVYLSSSLHRQGATSLRDLTWQQRPWHALLVSLHYNHRLGLPLAPPA